MGRKLANGLWVADVGDVATWDGREWIPAPPLVIPGPPGPRGGGGGMGMQGPQGPAGPAGPAAPVLSYEGALAADRFLTSGTYTSLFAFPFVKVGATALYVEATFGATIVKDATVVQDPGVKFRLLLDGTPLGIGPDGRVATIFTTRAGDPSNVSALGGGSALQFKLSNVTCPPGAHTLTIQWAILTEVNGGVAPTITAFCSPASSDWYAEIYAQEI